MTVAPLPASGGSRRSGSGSERCEGRSGPDRQACRSVRDVERELERQMHGHARRGRTGAAACHVQPGHLLRRPDGGADCRRRCRTSWPSTRRACCCWSATRRRETRGHGGGDGAAAAAVGRRQQALFRTGDAARAGRRVAERLPFAVRALLIGDLPTNLWWAAHDAAAAGRPAAARSGRERPADHVRQPRLARAGRGVAATVDWLERIERGDGRGRWRVASDLNWRRLKYWRRLLTQALEPARRPAPPSRSRR